MPPLPTVRLVAGAMTGTSLDGLDAALVRIEGIGLDLRPEVVRHAAWSLGELEAPLRRAAEQAPMTTAEMAGLMVAFGRFHAEALAELAGDDVLDLACVHGQTVAHGATATWQLIDPAPIAARLGCPVVSDLRRADMAAGGRGAPLTPLADWFLYADCPDAQAIVNLGGFVNATLLPSRDEPAPLESIDGFDVCACNQVLDAVARRALGMPFDEDGRAAARGTIHAEARMTLARILEGQARDARALGTGDEAAAWVDRFAPACTGADLAATATDAVAGAIASRLGRHPMRPRRIVLAGGGTRHEVLVGAIALHAATVLPSPAVMTADHTPVAAVVREAAAMAVLGALAVDGIPISLPQVTGCSRPAPRGACLCPAAVPRLS